MTLRRPVALALRADGQQVFVANRDSGSISTVDVATGKAVDELFVGGRLTDLSWNGGNDPVLVVDARQNDLLILRVNSSKLELASRLRVASDPSSVRTQPDFRQAFVVSRWSHRVTMVDLTDLNQPRATAIIDLPFAPRDQCLSPDHGILVVADAFGGKIAIIDVPNGRLLAVREVTGHNLRGLTWDHDRKSLLIVHQILHAEEGTTEGAVHWGGVMSNVLRSVPLEWLLTGKPALEDKLYYLGHPERATGDPANLVVTSGRRRVIAFAGLGEIGVSDVGANVYDHVAVGLQPSAAVLSPDEQTVIVANTLSDSISLVGITSPTKAVTISLGPQRELTAAERGEILFHDARLASDGWFSCHSCHTDGHSNGGKSDTFGDTTLGAPKRVLSLLGVGETAPWAWNGQVAKLDQQVRKSLELTMRGKPPTDQQVSDLTKYLRSLAAPPSILAARFGDRLEMERPELATSVKRGQELFDRRNCASCHTPEVYTSDGTYNVRLQDELGNREFNPPSLRGVSQRDRLFHDNRSAGLREVLAKFQHGLDEPLSEQQIEDLVNFLRNL